MPEKQEKGTGNLALGGGLTAYGASQAPVLRHGSKDMSRMQGASPKKQPGRYQAELHQAMKEGKVPTESSVHVLRTPSGRHINAGGTHRQIAREAMNKPSEYKVKDISHEIHVSPAQKLKGKLQVAGLTRGSKRAEAGKPVKPVGPEARSANRILAHAADVNDARAWENPSMFKEGAKVMRHKGWVGAGTLMGVGALSGAAGLAERHEWKKKNQVSKGKRIMSDAEIKRRKKIGSHLSQAGGAVGLTALGGTLLASRGGRNAMRAIPKLRPHVAAPKTLKADRDKIQGVVNPLLATGAGLGGVGAFNFASYTGAEARKRTMTPAVKKSLDSGLEMGYFGEEGHPLKLPEIEVAFEKAWEPSAGKFDSEKSRGKRAKGYEAGAYGVAGGAGAYSGHQAIKTGKKLKELPVKMAPLSEKKVGRGKKRMGVDVNRGHIVSEKAIPLSRVKETKVLRHGGKAAAGAAIAGGALYGAHKIKEKSQSGGSWTPYAKRDAVSAFGIDHSH